MPLLRPSRLELVAFCAGVGVGLLLGALLLFAGLARSGPDVIDERYATWREAHQAGADARGWLPGFVPEVATDIRLKADPKRGDLRGAFHFPPQELPKLQPHLANMPSDEVAGSTPLPTPYDAWWPDWLQGTLESGPPRNPGFSLHRPIHPDGEVDEMLVACSFTRGYCLFWSDRR